MKLRWMVRVERWWQWDSRADQWCLHETKSTPVLQYQLAPAAAWHSVETVEVLTRDPGPMPK